MPERQFPSDDERTREIARAVRESLSEPIDPREAARVILEAASRLKPNAATHPPQLTPYEIALRAGLIGCVEGPPDLSTNKAYMEGFGEDNVS
ncbi:MAG: hypothetical protein ACKVZJ_04490 [Phycisphaerales bacterium]